MPTPSKQFDWKPRFLTADGFEVRRAMKAEKLLEKLNNPKAAERLKSLGWNIEEARSESLPKN